MKNAICMVLAFVLLAGMASAGISVTNYSVSQGSFKPGASGVATLTLTNPSGSERVSGLTMSISSPQEITVSGAPPLADIMSGGSAVVSMPIKIKADARPGIYLLNVIFTGYERSADAATQLPVTNAVSIPIIILNPPILSLSADNEVISGIQAVNFSVMNNGGPAKNLRISIPSTSPVALFKVNELYVGNVSGTATAAAVLDARSASDGAVDVQFNISYEDELGISHSDAPSLRLTVKNEVLDLRFNQLAELTTRKEGTLSLEVVNNGESISDVRLSFANATMQIKDKNEIKIGDLAPGERKTVSASVYNELEPGLNPVRAKISWVERDIRKEQYMDIPLTITSDADVGVYLEAKPLPLTLGGQHTITVQVSNLGTYPIENVDVSLSSPALRTMDISDRQYIGGLQTDDFSSVQFLTQVNATGEGSYPIYLDVRYRDSSGEWKNKTVVQQVTLHASLQAAESPLPLLALLGAAAVAVWYFRFRKVSK
jgi:hypothetical protein